MMSIIVLCITVPVLAQPAPPTPFVIYGYVIYEDGSECRNPVVNITNLNSGAKWHAKTYENSSYYLLVLAKGASVNTKDTLLFEVRSTEGSLLNITHRNITLEDLTRGGIFNFNIILEAPQVLPVFDTGTPANPYPSIAGTHYGAITPNVTIYNVSRLYTYPCPDTGGHTEYVAFYADPDRTERITEGYWNGYTGDWHNITFNPFTMHANRTYYYTLKTGSYPQIHHTDGLPAEGWMGIINCTSFVDANGKRYNNWIPAIRLTGNFTALERVHNVNTDEHFYSIQAAIDDTDTEAGHTIVVYPGTYRENVVLNKRLTLRGIGMPTIDAHGTGNGITITADGCVVDGLNVRGALTDGSCGVKETSDGNILANNAVFNNMYGICLEVSSNNMLINNVVYSNKINGICVYVSMNNKLIDNIIINNHLSGLELESSFYNMIMNLNSSS